MTRGKDCYQHKCSKIISVFHIINILYYLSDTCTNVFMMDPCLKCLSPLLYFTVLYFTHISVFVTRFKHKLHPNSEISPKSVYWSNECKCTHFSSTSCFWYSSNSSRVIPFDAAVSFPSPAADPESSLPPPPPPIMFFNLSPSICCIKKDMIQGSGIWGSRYGISGKFSMFYIVWKLKWLKIGVRLLESWRRMEWKCLYEHLNHWLWGTWGVRGPGCQCQG